MEAKTLVVLEGQQHWIEAEIAQSDELLRQLFSTLSPDWRVLKLNGMIIGLI